MRLNDIVLRLVGRDLAQVKDFFEYLDDLVPCREDDELDTGAYSQTCFLPCNMLTISSPTISI